MSVEQTQQTMDSYFEAMGQGDDFSRFYTTDVTWTMIDSGKKVRGPSAVQDYVVALHSRMFDHQHRDIAVSDRNAYLEGDCLDSPGGSAPRYAYCLVYDLHQDRISAMRCYGSIARLMPESEY